MFPSRKVWWVEDTDEGKWQ